MGVKVPVRKYVKLRRMKTESKSCVDFAEKSTDEVLLACMYVVTNDEEYIRIQNMKRDGGEYEFEVLYSDMRSRLSVRIFDFRSSTKARFEFEEYVPENVGLGYRFFFRSEHKHIHRPCERGIEFRYRLQSGDSGI